ncbi:MAG: MurR/RpiR family transcriptional regulator [Cellulosilyticaceae bacterium]
MKPVLIRLKEYMRKASESEKEIINYILSNPSLITKCSVQQLAKETFSSPSTIVRLSRKIGFDGFKEMKKALIIELTLRDKVTLSEEKEIMPTDTTETLIDKMIYKHIVSIEETRTLIDPDVFKQCVSALMQAQTIYIFGIGSSYLVAKDLQQKLMRVNKPCVAFEDYHMQILQARNILPQDLAIIISYSGESKEMVQCSQMIQASGVPSIAITRFGKSQVAELADYNLFVTANEPLIRSGAMTSRIAQLCMIDMLYLAYIHNCYEEAFQSIHKTHIHKSTEKE